MISRSRRFFAPNWVRCGTSSSRSCSVIYAVNKPYDMLSQHTSNDTRTDTLATLGIPRKDVYAVGRLDKDSEGLLLLSNDASFVTRVLSDTVTKLYLVQVDGEISLTSLRKLQCAKFMAPFKPAISISIVEPAVSNNFEAPPAESTTAQLWQANHVRKRKATPTQWVRVELAEGKNRQVRAASTTS